MTVGTAILAVSGEPFLSFQL